MRVYSVRLLWSDGRPLAGATLGVARGTAATPEIGLRSDADGRVSLGLPDGAFEVLLRTPGGLVARTTLETRTLPIHCKLTVAAASDAPPGTKEEDMVTTVSNVQSEPLTEKLGSVSNDEPAAELAAAPKVLDRLEGSPGTPDAGPGISAPNLIVRGTAPFKRKPRATGSALESLIGEDERVRIPDTDLAPWRMVCSLEIHSRFGEYIGTGWFAGPRTVITAGHCVHHKQMGGWATEIVVRAGCDGAKAPFGAVTSKRFSTTDRWLAEANPDFDYAAIHLGEGGPPVTSKTGWFSTAVLNDAALASQRVNVAGYPSDKGGDTQWFHAKQIVFLTPYRIFYDVDTIAGQSGAPVWLATDDGPRVVGIHAYGVGASVPNVEANSAPKITDAVLQRIKEWLAV